MTLAEIIVKRIPASMLERVVFDQAIVDENQRTVLFKASGVPTEEIARRIVDAYGTDTSKLAFGLYEQVFETDWETAALLFEHFRSRPESYYYNHQASLVGRIPTLPMEGLSEFLLSVKRHVCLIVSRQGNNGPVVRGTGFLVGPDMVLTCRHVLKSFPKDADVAANGSRIEVYFDFYRGEPVDGVGPHLPQARKVALATVWHVESCDDTVPDGLDGDLSAEDAARIAKSLDFLLLRVAEPVGLQPLERGGGPRRNWINLPDDTVPKSLQPQDWIIIPQHPDGFPQRIDLGRFRAADQTGTRIRYDTNTSPGSSGAPCFNQNFALVGVHNAYVGPPHRPLANQAIRVDHIAARLRPHTDTATKADRHAPRWSIARAGDEPRVILGRETLLVWLRASATARPKTLADRVYAAQATVPGAGCTFSIDVLHAEIRDTKTPRAVYGERGQQLPATVEDFLVSLLRELGIELRQGEGEDRLPERPRPVNAGVPASSFGEVDKLDRWISDELPDWLGGLISRNVEKHLDAREAARQAIEIYRQQALEPPSELTKTASSPEPVLVRPNAWDFAYVVVDGLRLNSYTGAGAHTGLTGEVRDLIAALVRGKPEQAMHPGLRRLRWMFLGYLPDFIPVAEAEGNGATIEVLDPASVGVDEVLAILDRISQAYIPTPGDKALARATAGFVVGTAEIHGGAKLRLVSLQDEASRWSAGLLKEVGD